MVIFGDFVYVTRCINRLPYILNLVTLSAGQTQRDPLPIAEGDSRIPGRGASGILGSRTDL